MVWVERPLKNNKLGCLSLLWRCVATILCGIFLLARVFVVYLFAVHIYVFILFVVAPIHANNLGSNFAVLSSQLRAFEEKW